MRAIIIAIWLMASLVLARSEKAIIPVSAWPSVIHVDGKTCYQPSAETCVQHGYRMIPEKPLTPTGKQIKSESFVQDDKDATKVKYEIVYEDKPVVVEPVYVPEVLTNIAPAKCLFVFTTNGQYRGTTWVDAPKTNVIK